MKRIDIHYGGQTYSVGGRELADLQQEISEGLAKGAYWLVVNDGEGERRDAHLLITASSDVALIPVPEPPE